MQVRIKYIAILASVVCLQSFGYAQTVKERSLIIGVWMAEGGSRRLEFKANGECIEYIPVEMAFSKYSYKVSYSMPVCISGVPKAAPNPKRTYLQMTGREDGIKFCYLINGLTDKILSISPLGQGGFTLFERVKKENNR